MPKTKRPTFIAESMCVPGDGNNMRVSVAQPLPCIVILVHGVNSEGEWYEKTEKGIVAGLNMRLGRGDLVENEYTQDQRTLLALKKSPVIRFYWGYRAPKEQTDASKFAYRIPLKRRTPRVGPNGTTLYTYQPYSIEDASVNQAGASYYWGGGPFQNGTTALNTFWHAGFDPKILGGLVDLGNPQINAEPSRAFEKAPSRTYYVNAAKRLAQARRRSYADVRCALSSIHEVEITHAE